MLSPACRPVEECTVGMLLVPIAEWRGCPRATDTGRNQVLVLLWRADAENERGRPVQRDYTGPGKVLRGEPGVYFAALDRVRRFLGQEAAKEYVARGQLCQGVNARQTGVNPKFFYC